MKVNTDRDDFLKIFTEEGLNHALIHYTLQDIYACVNTIVKVEVSQPFCVTSLEN